VHEVDHSPPSGVEVESEGNYTSAVCLWYGQGQLTVQCIGIFLNSVIDFVHYLYTGWRTKCHTIL